MALGGGRAAREVRRGGRIAASRCCPAHLALVQHSSGQGTAGTAAGSSGGCHSTRTVDMHSAQRRACQGSNGREVGRGCVRAPRAQTSGAAPPQSVVRISGSAPRASWSMARRDRGQWHPWRMAGEQAPSTGQWHTFNRPGRRRQVVSRTLRDAVMMSEHDDDGLAACRARAVHVYTCGRHVDVPGSADALFGERRRGAGALRVGQPTAQSHTAYMRSCDCKVAGLRRARLRRRRRSPVGYIGI